MRALLLSRPLRCFARAKLPTLLVATVGVATVGVAALPGRAETRRLRLTETSVTESGGIEGDSLRLQTQGYGFTYVTPLGLGVSYTFLTTAGDERRDDGLASATLQHDYLDLSETLGTSWLATFGGGVNVGGRATLRAPVTGEAGESREARRDTTHARGWDLFVGPGYAFGAFEVYWIYRRNTVTYRFADGGAPLRLASVHYQLGLGVNF